MFLTHFSNGTSFQYFFFLLANHILPSSCTPILSIKIRCDASSEFVNCLSCLKPECRSYSTLAAWTGDLKRPWRSYIGRRSKTLSPYRQFALSWNYSLIHVLPSTYPFESTTSLTSLVLFSFDFLLIPPIQRYTFHSFKKVQWILFVVLSNTKRWSSYSKNSEVVWKMKCKKCRNRS